MKKLPSLFFSAALILMYFAGCSSTPNESKSHDAKKNVKIGKSAGGQKHSEMNDSVGKGQNKVPPEISPLLKKSESKSTSATLPDNKRTIAVVAKTVRGQSQKVQLYDYATALIVGIDRYTNLSMSEQLTYAVKDAKGVEQVLRDNFKFDDIITLYNEQATRDAILKCLYGFHSISPDSGVLVYFAGHGITLPGTVGEGDLGFLVPYDGSLDANEMYKNISMQQIKADICVSISAKHVFFIFDACFAGLMLDTRGTNVQSGRDFAYLKAITNEQVRQVLTAGSKGQAVLDGGPGGHSVFTGRLIQALKNVDDYVTARELSQYLKRRVYADAASRGHTQRPVDGEIYGTGDFVFVANLEKRHQETRAEIEALESEIEHLNKLKATALKSQDQATAREIERQRLVKAAELKRAQILEERKKAALKRRRQLDLEAEELETKRSEREEENQRRLALLQERAEKMRLELGNITVGGDTVDSAVSELKLIQSQCDKIQKEFAKESDNQIRSLERFYDKRIARAMHIPPRDKEFETKQEYQSRLTAAERKATPLRIEKSEKLASVKENLQNELDKQIEPLRRQMKILKSKSFVLPVSKVSFDFFKYYLNSQIMEGSLATNGMKKQFFVPIPREKAKEYKYHSELLVPEVHVRARLNGPRISKTVFHGPGPNENYASINCVAVAEKYVAYADGTVRDMSTDLLWKVGPDKDTNWDEARSWVQSLGGDWRMPTMNELKDFYEKGKDAWKPLLKTTGWFGWSGETRGTSNAWFFNFRDGTTRWCYRLDARGSRAFAVRSRSDG